jgi:hypothetical protein
MEKYCTLLWNYVRYKTAFIVTRCKVFKNNDISTLRVLCCHLPERWFLARLIFDHEDGDETFLRNGGSNTDYTGAILQKMAPFITTAARTSLISLLRLILIKYFLILLICILFVQFIILNNSVA